jgi:hypothetical protein
MEVGVEVESRTAPPPELGSGAVGEMMAKAAELAPRYRTDLMLP